MVEQDSPYQRISVVPAKERAEPKYPWMGERWFRLLALLFLAELFVPFLRWPIGMPKMIEGGIHGLIGLAVLAAFAIMLAEDRIPKGILVILAITLIWGIVVMYEGQSIPAFMWGWYRMFKYPLLGLFAYLTVDNPKDFAKWFIRFCLVLLAFQVGVQIAMYAMGYPTGDHLAGTFGRYGAARFIMMVFFILSIVIGYWMATRDLKYLAITLVIGFIGGTLSGTKLFLIALALLLGLAALIQVVRGGKIRQLLASLLLFLVLGAAFVIIYNNFLVQNGLPTLQEYLLESDRLEAYLFVVDVGSSGGYYLGRGQSVIHGWQQIQQDSVSVMFGHGLGSRSSSSILGIGGTSFQSDVYGGVSSSGLGIWIQEYGVVGLLLFLLIATWIIMLLFRLVRRFSDPHQIALAYGLILFTACFPVWVFYIDLTTAGVMAILYCVSLAYLLRQAHDLPRPAPARH